jgi:hypothetical protein
MEWLTHLGKQVEPVQFVYGVIAVCGGIARYLNGYTNGTPFKFGVFAASTFVSGFSGWTFAAVGLSLNMPDTVVFIMAGTGGFFGEQTMKLVLEWIQNKKL